MTAMPDVTPGSTGSSGIAVRPIDGPAELRSAVELYRAVLHLTPTDPAVSPRLLAALRRNGGSVVGAFVGDRLVGFAYGFLGKDALTGDVYHYSQAAVVDAAWQGRGVGRAMKQGQRDFVLGTGVTRMRWSFDPVRAGNGHFNLDVLGARARWFVRNLYGVDDMGRDVGHPSDRLIVDWDLAGRPAPSAPSVVPDGAPNRLPGWGESLRDGTELLIGVPSGWPPEGDAAGIRQAISAAFESAIGAEYVAVSCRTPRGSDTAWYVLCRGEPVQRSEEVEDA